MSEKPWHVSNGDQALGPFSEQEVTEGWQRQTIGATWLCWRDGMPTWARVCDTKPFKSIIEQASIAACEEQRRQILKWRGRVFKGIAACALSVGIGIALYHRHPILEAIRDYRVEHSFEM